MVRLQLRRRGESADQVAAKALTESGCWPGCTAREIAFGMGFAVISHATETFTDGATIHYAEDLHPRERDAEIFRQLAVYVLRSQEPTDDEIDDLASALARAPSSATLRIW